MFVSATCWRSRLCGRLKRERRKSPPRGAIYGSSFCIRVAGLRAMRRTKDARIPEAINQIDFQVLSTYKRTERDTHHRQRLRMMFSGMESLSLREILCETRQSASQEFAAASCSSRRDCVINASRSTSPNWTREQPHDAHRCGACGSLEIDTSSDKVVQFHPSNDHGSSSTSSAVAAAVGEQDSGTFSLRNGTASCSLLDEKQPKPIESSLVPAPPTEARFTSSEAHGRESLKTQSVLRCCSNGYRTVTDSATYAFEGQSCDQALAFPIRSYRYASVHLPGVVLLKVFVVDNAGQHLDSTRVSNDMLGAPNKVT